MAKGDPKDKSKTADERNQYKEGFGHAKKAAVRENEKRLEEVRVKAGAGHKAYTTHRLKDAFDTSISYSERKQHGEDTGNIPGHTDEEGNVVLETKMGPASREGGKSGPHLSYGSLGTLGHYGDLRNFSPERLVQVTGQLANEIYQGTDPQAKESSRRNQAVNEAISRVRDAAAAQAAEAAQESRKAGVKTKRSQLGIDIQQLTPKNVAAVAFTSRVERPSKAEIADKYPKKDVGSKAGVHEKSIEQWLTEQQPPPAPKSSGLTEKQLIIAKAQKRKDTLSPGEPVSKAKKSPQQFMKSVSPDEGKWINQQMEDPKGIFFGMKNNQIPGAYRRWQRYVNAREAGYSDKDNIVNWLTAETRGRKSTRKHKEKTDAMVEATYTKGIVNKEGRKATDRYKSLAPSHEEFGVGIRVPGIASIRELKEQNPDASDKEIFEIRESNKQSVHEKILNNQRELHEQRQHNVLQRKASETGASNEDRVVFFTTSTGWPAVSTSANSLLGQYIIHKRKKMLVDQKMAPRTALKGEFPYAVRDQHVVEVATGLSIGAQGRYGAFRHTGYRVGAAKSKGYGKMLPIGSQVMRGADGQAMYDRNGNVRYTEGFTRPFDIRPSNEVGLRVYVG